MPTTEEQNVYWINLVTGTTGTSSFTAQFDAQVGITFAPSGNAAFVRYDTDNIADYRMVNLCPGIYLRDVATGATRTVVNADTPIPAASPGSAETFTTIVGS